MNQGRDLAALAGRVLLALTFVLSGWSKTGHLAGTAGYIASKGLPFPDALAFLAIVIELGVGLALVIGFKARWAAAALALFLVIITPLFHDFWAAAADQAMNQQINFMKNTAILGGMLMVVAFGPGRYSVDRG
jgi:putative oxidoreductase